MESIELDLLINWITGRQYEASIVRSPFGRASHRFEVPGSSSLLIDLETGTTEGIRDLRRPPASVLTPLMLLQDQGRELSQLVFTGSNRDVFRKCLEAHASGNHLRLRLTFRKAPVAADWPWEALMVDGSPRFLATLPRVSFERSFELTGVLGQTPVAKNDLLRILIVGASPRGFSAIGLKREQARISAVFKKAGVPIEVKLATSRPSLDRATASKKAYDVVHMICHGDFEGNEGGVWLENRDKNGSRLASRELPAFLRRSVGLVFLNACNSGRGASDPFAGFPEALLCAGTSAVVAMRRPITDSGAIELAEEFYRSIANGEKLGRALANWRETCSLDSGDWSVPVLFLAGEDFALLPPPQVPEPEPPKPPPPPPPRLPRLPSLVLVAFAAAAIGLGLMHFMSPPDPDPSIPPPVVPADARCPSPDGLDFSFVYVPPGSFEQGSEKVEDERPVHKVTLTSGFCLGAFELTRGLYARIVGSPPPEGAEAYFPVEGLTWNEARQLVEKLAELHPEAGFRLPTGAEWEYAARAGRPGDEDEAESAANCLKRGEKDPYSGPSAVGSFDANFWGFYDMKGNVWEWVADWEAAYAKEPAIDPAGPAEGEKKVRRGGSYKSTLKNCRYSTRAGLQPDREQEAAGVRIARSPVMAQN